MAKRIFRRMRRRVRRTKRARRALSRPRRFRRAARRPMRTIAPNVASVIESFELPAVTFGAPDNYDDFALANSYFDRAQQVAKAYREFRIKWVELRFMFPYNSYEPGSGAGIPTWCLVTDPRDAIPDNYNKGLLLDMGKKYKKCMGMQRIVFAPYIRTGGLFDEGTYPYPSAQLPIFHPVTIRKHPWIPCNMAASTTDNTAFAASSMPHTGVKWDIDAIGTVSPQPGIHVQVRVCFQFRRPVWYVTEPPPEVQALAQNEEDTPDLVHEGGDDAPQPLPPPGGGN